MTLTEATPLRPYRDYLSVDADRWPVGSAETSESTRLGAELTGPDPTQSAFALVAALVAAREIDALHRLVAHRTGVHTAIDGVGGSAPDSAELARAIGPPLRDDEPATVHALRALAALGLALAAEEPRPELLRAALRWHRAACAAPSGITSAWRPDALADGDPQLRRCLDLLAEVAGPDRDSMAALTAAVTLRRLRHPTVTPRSTVLLGQRPADEAAAADRGRRRPARVRLPRRNPRRHAVTALLDQGTTGTDALLALTVDPALPGGLIPDPERMSLLAADDDFRAALGRAWRLAGKGGIRGLAVWSASTAEGPTRYLSGESAGAPFAVIVGEARRLATPLAGLALTRRVVSSNAVTGRIDDAGRLQSVEGYDAKFSRLAAGARVIVPAIDEDRATQAARQAAADGRAIAVLPAARWTDAARAARRLDIAATVRAGLTALVVVVLIIAAVALQQRHDASVAASDAARSHAIAISGQLADASEGLDHADPVIAAALAAAAWQWSPTNAARDSLLAVLAQPLRGVLTRGGPYAWAGFSPGRGAVLATVGRTAQLWSTATLRPLGRPMTLPGGSAGAAISPDGGILATADGDGTARLWDLATDRAAGAPLAASPSGSVNAVAFNPAGTVLATADGDGTARLWDLATHRQIGAPLRAGTADAGQVMDVAFSPDGKLLATASLDGTARLWDVATHRQIGAPMTDGNRISLLRQVLHVAFSPTGKTLATVGSDGRLRLWNVSTQRPAGVPEEAGGVARDAAFGPAFGLAGAMLAVAEDNGTALLWDTITKSTITALDAKAAGSMTALAVSPDGSLLATIGADGTATLWNLTMFHSIGPTVQTGIDSAAAFSQDGRSLATAGFDGKVRFWNLATGHQALPAITVSRSWLTAIAVSPDGQSLAGGAADGPVRLWNLLDRRAAGRPIRVTGVGGVTALAFSPHGHLLATAADGEVQPWDPVNGDRAGPAVRLGDAVTALAFSPDGTVIAAVTAGHSVRLWNVATGRRAAGLNALDGQDAVAFSPDGTMLATGGDDGAAQLWDLATGQAVGDPMDASLLYGALGVAFSPDGAMLATVGGDGRLRLWDVATGREIGPEMLAGNPASGANSVTFSADGATIAAFGPADEATLWDVAFPRDLLSAVCAVAGPPLDREQWNSYAPSVPDIRACP